ncbi:hypothetical protein CWB99_14215 [Pseudoalteromonas rubra]|uniref:Carboxymuconolactone decarboxylase-like domain-containing protein n=1 Tax=Pseudoalteromonas rubra TaxID=43658 RepID=A0A5S3WJU6_9GAMM|nr:hypothetical protein [Pseudoalteromonas rubra]TMP27606.1 hypothetical protein CWB99_14215 [Pseudoalteromonas rubra]TMP28911.1 hypothetical protein CWC00_20305 [Pseudoalteromonas rubra]
MIKYLLNKMLISMQKKYDYDVAYMQDILCADLSAFFKYLKFQSMAGYRGGLPPAPLYAARLRAILWDDCGPCTQLLVNMALEAAVPAAQVSAIVNKELAALPDELAQIVEFTDLVLAHDPSADDIRPHIRAMWGDQGLIAIAFSISSCRVYPALKYTLGYGKACSRVVVNEQTLTPSDKSRSVTG